MCIFVLINGITPKRVSNLGPRLLNVREISSPVREALELMDLFS